MESKLDRMVMTMLKGLDLDKHEPLFEKYNINLDLFLSLNEDDLKAIGIDDQEEIDLLVKYMKKFRKNEKWPDPKSLQLDEIAEILKNTEDYLHLMNTACDYAHKSMQQGKPLDIIVHNDTAASSAIATICERIQDENETILKDIDSLIKDAKKRNDKPNGQKEISIGFCYLAGALLGAIVAGVLFFRKNSFQ